MSHLHNTISGKICIHYQCGMGRDIVVTVLCLKLWPHQEYALQQTFDNLDVESAIDSMPFMHRLFMNHAMYVKGI